MARTRQLLAIADLALVLVDLSGAVATPPELLDDLPPGLPRLVVGTKADLAAKDTPARWLGEPVNATSARTGAGIAGLRDRLLAATDAEGLRRAADLGILLNDRHSSRLREAGDELAELRDEVIRGAPDEVTATLLAGILTRLEEITGGAWSERLLDDVFSRFCIGK